MAAKKIRTFEDQILRTPCEKVEAFNDEILEILNDMMDTLHQTQGGASLAANQIGILKQLVVIDYCGKKLKLINPEIVSTEGMRECIEGCLSFPGTYLATNRPRKVTVRAKNEFGEELQFSEEGDLAKCLCHEIDHLNGILFFERTIQKMRCKSEKD